MAPAKLIFFGGCWLCWKYERATQLSFYYFPWPQKYSLRVLLPYSVYLYKDEYYNMFVLF